MSNLGGGGGTGPETIRSPDRTDVGSRGGSRRRWPWVVLGSAVLVLGGLYVTAYALIGDRVPRSTTVLGVDIGGLRPDAARERLQEQLGGLAERPVTFVYDDADYRLDPVAAGLSLDVEQTVLDAGGGRSWNPVRMLEVLAGNDSTVDPVVRADAERLDAAVDEIADQVDTPASEGAVRIDGVRPRIVQPVVGVTVDREATAEAAQAAYLVQTTAVDLPVVERQPSLTGSELRAFVDDHVDAVVGTPIRLLLPGQRLWLGPHRFAPALSWDVDGGEPAVVVDAERLATATQGLLNRIPDKPVNASLELRNGRPVVVPGRPGATIRPDEIEDAVRAVAADPDQRRIRVGTAVSRPQVTTHDLERLGVKEVVSDFVTYFPHAEYRNINQGRAAELIDGTLLRPGDTFSFNDTVGERTVENGFTTGFIIRNGVFAEDLGGGVSQVATTTYNAAFFAGLDDVTHTPHSFYIDRYPLGREATLAWPSVDLKFRNSTPYGVMIHAWVVPSTPTTSGEMHVQMFSTKYWDITAGVSDRFDFTSPGTRYDPSDRCVANDGYGGFEVLVYRFFRRHGSPELVRRETDHVVYTPSDTVICTAPPGG